MDKERYIEIENSGLGLTKAESDAGWHFCLEFDSMLVGPNTSEALVCSCNHPAIEAWKKSEQGIKMMDELMKRMDNPALDKLSSLDEEIGL